MDQGRPDYGCDMCGDRFDWDTEIIWVTSSFGLCERCHDKLSQEELEEYQREYE